MSRAATIAAIERYFDSGGFMADLSRRVAIPTESQNPERGAALSSYLKEEMQPGLERQGFKCTILPNPSGKGGPTWLPSGSKMPPCRRCLPMATAM